ncbi:reverse transcriptase domain-containing protein [Tanacetum coccineum]
MPEQRNTKRRHENRRLTMPDTFASVFKRLKRNRPPSLRPRPRKEGGVFNRLGGKERSASARSDDCHQSSHEKEIEAAAKTERWAMPTWCHMFNSTLTGNAKVWFDKLPRESVDSYEDLRTAFRENYLQQTKHIKDPVEIHHIKQRDRESTVDFMERYKAEILDVEGASECMKISGFMHGEVAAFSYSRKKAPAPWKQPEGGNKPNFKKGFKNKQRSDRKSAEKQELKQAKPKAQKNGKAEKDKHYASWMIQPWERVAKQRFTQSFSSETIISFPSLGKEDKTEGPMIIEAEIGGHFVHRIYVDGGASLEVLYEHYFVRIRPEIKSQMIPATTSLIGFSRETIWPIGQISLLVKIGDEEHSTSAWMNFMVIRDAHLSDKRKGGQAPERNKAIQEEVEKLVDAGIMKKVHYHSWLSNPDGYPLPEIDWKVESLCGYPFKCFLDAYKGYHQIKMAEEDEEKTTFITSQGIFCYTKMPFGLKNAGATYQRMQEGMFLGYKVNAEGLKVCPDKADAVLSLPSPGCLKDVQKLNGKLASLNIFLSKSAEKSLPFFKTLKKYTKKSDFQWTHEVEVAFKQMKKLIVELPMLTAPKEKEELIMYRKGRQAITSVLCEPCPTRVGDQLHPHGKIIISLAQQISGRMLKWKFELEGYDIQYRPRTSIKGQILADFIVERPDEESPDELMAEPEELPEPWTLFTDGSSCIDGSGAGLILTNPEGVEFTYAMRFRFEATNNEAEYEALIAGLRIAEQMGVKNLQANVDFRPVANQVNGSYVAKESGMVQYLEKVKMLASNFKEFSIKQVPQSENKKADALSKIASTSFAHLSKQVLVEELKEKSIHEKKGLAIVEEEGKTWMTPICEHLTKEILPEDKKKARVVRRKASRYTMINGTLYKKSFLGPWLRCVEPLQANYVLREIYEGSYSMHSGPRSVVAKAIRTGYYWPTMHTDARKLIREYNDCQVHRPIPRNPQQNLTPITSPWPFYNWGINIAGPFPEGPSKVKFLIVAIDYFTKWIEANPVATITGN